ncbi:MAG: hypothetical protein RMJ82_06825 [Gemmatales bacterium]|nr:hypothetical protein [Gemmatales bacterium]
MSGRRYILGLIGLLGLVVVESYGQTPVPGANPTNYYYYPYYYFPHNYWPNQQPWPNSQPFQLPPPYMSYPPYLDKRFRYELFSPKPYYKGFHFWLDQF